MTSRVFFPLIEALPPLYLGLSHLQKCYGTGVGKLQNVVLRVSIYLYNAHCEAKSKALTYTKYSFNLKLRFNLYFL